MSDSNQHSERIAQQFHEVYERLAPEYAYETREESRVAWIDVPPKNRELMIATVEEVMGGFFEQLEAAREALREIADSMGLDFFNAPEVARRALDCVCGEINTRHCPVHGQDSIPASRSESA